MNNEAQLDDWLRQAKNDGVITVNLPSIVNTKKPRKEPRDILPEPKQVHKGQSAHMRDQENAFDKFLEMCPIVAQWIRFRKTKSAKDKCVYPFLYFCREANIMPKDFGELNKTKEQILKARDMVWDVCLKLINEDRIWTARSVQVACKGFFRFYCKGDAELPFDRGAGGFHQISTESHRVAEFEWGTFEEAKEHFRDILSKAKGLTMRTITFLIYVCGWRLNVFEHLKWKHLEEIGVIDVDGQDVLVIKITPQLDTKQSKALKKYYSFITGEALESLQLYEKRFRKGRDSEQTVFRAPQNEVPIKKHHIQRYFKIMINACENEGLLKKGSNKPGVLTPHKLRKVFRKVMQEAKGVEFEYKEFLMGHKLPGGATDVYALKDYKELAKAYLKADFSAPKEYYKRLWLEEQRAKEEMETATQIYKEPRPEGEAIETLETETPKEQIIIKNPIVQRMPKPAPNYCPRGLTFHNKNTDSYCHTLCAKTHPTQYQACQELQIEQPEMFAKKNTAQH